MSDEVIIENGRRREPSKKSSKSCFLGQRNSESTKRSEILFERRRKKRFPETLRRRNKQRPRFAHPSSGAQIVRGNQEGEYVNENF